MRIDIDIHGAGHVQLQALIMIMKEHPTASDHDCHIYACMRSACSEVKMIMTLQPGLLHRIFEFPKLKLELLPQGA